MMEDQKDMFLRYAGRVADCVSKDLSRLGHNSVLTGLYTNFTFPQYDVHYIAINDDFDTIQSQQHPQ